jgi:hypothetical protein
MVNGKRRRSASWTNSSAKRVDRKKRRPRSLPELYDINQLDEQEMVQLTKMLQNAIESNPNLEQHLNALSL